MTTQCKFIDTLTNEYPITLDGLRSVFPLTIFYEPHTTPLMGFHPVWPVEPPDFDRATHEAVEGAPVVSGSGAEQRWEQTWVVVPKAPAEVQRIVAEKVELLWRAADTYTSRYISGVAIGILTIGVLQQKPKALAVSAWSSSVWAEYYKRKAEVTASSVDNHDFSAMGPIPHSVPELQAEIGL